MDKLHVNQTGGFPLTTNILNAMQNAYNIFNALGNLAGNYTIISGCEETGNKVSDGVVFVNNEVLPFKGGTKTSKVRIREVSESKQFEDGSTKAVVFKRWVEFGTASNAILWSDFKRFEALSLITTKLNTTINTLQNTLNSISNINTRVTTLENDPDDTVEPATQAEVDARKISHKYVSPLTLPKPPTFEETIIMSGQISASGTRITGHKKYFTCSKIATGKYRINHSIGNARYGVVGSGIDKGNFKVSLWERYTNYCVVGVSDDSSVNDGSFSFILYKI